MEFIFETVYDSHALTAMAKGLRKTIRKKRSRRSHIFGTVVLLLVLLICIANGFELSFRNVITWLAAAMILIALIWEDRLNGYFAGRKMLPGMKKSVTTFTPDGYHSVTGLGESDFPYDNIIGLAEMRDYFVFIFSANHAQIYDKRGLTGGGAHDFRKFIEEKTDCKIEYIK